MVKRAGVSHKKKPKELYAKLNNLPSLAGCYMFENSLGDIIYVGKSKALKKRVSQYFQGLDKKEGKHVALYNETTDFQFVLTETETDALLLECELIKKHKPRYNSQLVRTKKRPYIKINLNQDYPTISIAEKADDTAVYYGCFYNEDDALDTISLLSSVWETPLCGKSVFTEKTRACLNYHLSKCCAPCQKPTPIAQYRQLINDVIAFMDGECEPTITGLTNEMMSFSENGEYLKAAAVRDKITGLEALRRKNMRLNAVLDNRDFFLFISAYNEEGYYIYYIRDGESLHRKRFSGNKDRDASLYDLFLKEIDRDDFALVNGRQVTGYLQEISAKKLYVPLPFVGDYHNDKNGLAELLAAGVAEF